MTKRPWLSKTNVGQIVAMAAVLSSQDVRDLICQDPTRAAVFWGVLTIALRSAGSNISLKKAEKGLNLILMNGRRKK